MIEKPRNGEQPRLLTGENGRATRNYRISRPWRPLKRMIAAAVIIIALLVVISSWIQKGLWMQQLGYSSVFWTLLGVRLGLFGVAFVVALVYLWVNLRVAAKNGATFRVDNLTTESAVAAQPGIQIPPAVLKLATGTVTVVAALIFALVFYTQWDSVQGQPSPYEANGTTTPARVLQCTPTQIIYSCLVIFQKDERHRWRWKSMIMPTR